MEDKKEIWREIAREQAKIRWSKEGFVEVEGECQMCKQRFRRLVRASFAKRVKYCSKRCAFRAAYYRRKERQRNPACQ